jgi:DNA-binding NarL/FixJ family response regulator
LARVGIVSPQEVVKVGLKTLLERSGSWEVVTEDGGGPSPDLVLYDVLGLNGRDGSDLELLAKQNGTLVIAVGRDLRPDLQARAFELGAVAGISIGVTGEDLHCVLTAALTGNLDGAPAARRPESDKPLGREAGLSARESHVLRLIVQGYTNVEIAERLYLSVNSIKTYIRTAYRKLGVSSRQQAVTWAIQHGFPLEREE